MKRRQQRSQKITLEAIYRDGVIQPVEPPNIPENTLMQVTIEVPGDVLVSPPRRWMLPSRATPAVPTATSFAKKLGWTLFMIALLVYAATRLIRLADFPIYFFSDEAIQAVLAEDLIRNGFRDSSGILFPPYFKNDQVWNLSLSVYLQVLPVMLLGKSVFITRAVSVLISLFGAVAVTLILKSIFKNRLWWLGMLILAGTPAWFLHSRTAFETVLMVSFYALFLLCYLFYRCRSPNFIYLTLAFAAASFYAYSNGQAVIGLLLLLLGLFDFRYHWRQLQQLIQRRQWRPLVALLALVLLLAWPYLRFRIAYPTDLVYHLRTLDSYWLQDIPLLEKVSLFTEKYLYGLSPRYWFLPNEHDLIRHRMQGYYGHMRPELLPFLIIGVLVCLRRWRSAAYRTVLMALLVTPVGAATVDIAITRVLAFVVPATILMSLGLEWVLSRLPERPRAGASLACFSLLSLMNLWLLRDALVEGELWYRNYGLYGMQYGAPQLFEIIPEYLEEDSDTQIMLTPVWANGTSLFPRFFLPREELARVQTMNIDAFLVEKQPLSEKTLFIMTPPEYEQALASNKFESVRIERRFPYPDGSPGFYFVRLAYVDDVEAIFAAEEAERRRPVEEEIQLRGQMVMVSHSPFEAGRVADLFDGDTFTLVRVVEGKVALIELTFPEPRHLSGIAADFGTMDFRWTISLYAEGNGEPVVYEQIYRDLGPDPHVEILFDHGPARVSKARIEIEDIQAGEKAKIHVRELTLESGDSFEGQ